MSDDKSKGHNEVISKLEEQYGRVVFVRTPLGLVACRKPTPSEHQRLQDKVNDPKKSNSSAVREYVMACCVHPAPDEAINVLDNYPALPDSLAVALNDLAGGDLEVETGKS